MMSGFPDALLVEDLAGRKTWKSSASTRDWSSDERLSCLPKDMILPPVYRHAMLKGREWMARPQTIAA